MRTINGLPNGDKLHLCSNAAHRGERFNLLIDLAGVSDFVRLFIELTGHIPAPSVFMSLLMAKDYKVTRPENSGMFWGVRSAILN